LLFYFIWFRLKSRLTQAELKAFTRDVQAKNIKKSRFFTVRRA